MPNAVTKTEVIATIDRALDGLEQAIGSLRGDPTREQVFERIKATRHEPAQAYP